MVAILERCDGTGHQSLDGRFLSRTLGSTAMRASSLARPPIPSSARDRRWVRNVLVVITSAPASKYSRWIACTVSGASINAQLDHSGRRVSTPRLWSSVPNRAVQDHRLTGLPSFLQFAHVQQIVPLLIPETADIIQRWTRNG